MADTTEGWLQRRLAYARSMLDQARSMPPLSTEQNRELLALRAAFCAGACLLFSAQRVPSLDSPVPDESEPLAEAPDLTLGHELLGVNELLATTMQLQSWDDWGSYQPGQPLPLSLEDATRWAQRLDEAFVRRYGL